MNRKPVVAQPLTGAEEDRIRKSVAAHAFGWQQTARLLATLDAERAATLARTWPSKAEIAAMDDAEANAFLASRGLDVRLTTPSDTALDEETP